LLVLTDVNLAIRRGETVGLVGPNGAGKSTLLKLIGGTITPQRGRILLEGKPLPSLSPAEKARRIALVPQTPTVPAGFTCLDMVLMARNPHLRFLQWEGPHDMDISRHAMEMTGTSALASRTLTNLSGGERQRVFIARALAQEPSLLLLDEPTAHLDIAYQKTIMDMLEAIRQRTGVTMLMAIHDLTTAAQYCQRIVVLHQGHIVADGQPRDVLTAHLLSEVYGTSVSVSSHPVDGTPVVLPIRNHLH
jgi:iron complex transport system ATP-binding protein